MEAMIHGIILAFGLILPLGVQNIFVFSQGATQPRFIRALPATITAALCDTFLILLAVFGLSVIVLQFQWLRLSLMIVGILFLLYMGYVIWKSKPTTNESNKALSIRQQVIFALSVSLLNPHAILDTVAVIGTSALKYAGTEQIFFAIACITVSWIWFFGLTLAGTVIKNLDSTGSLINIFNKCSALFIWGTAVYLFIGLI
ncbi:MULTISPECIES: LysE/ArgO family amino acid transporter [Bacillus cereus group]|uniref:Lysine exporter protein (LYSE/YGGA) n=1 Tax=Bacillus cytotoxicus (strain DSM 22905 / CIP 110041 / 391-98 / NVH 391-98) TaxID=315749 RepID=A7GPV1_BACCN|nr:MULTISPECIES: LysE/ArgO family amino acid transporter [Bacillus cereus group]ABS22159.1 Lysine exporter protein (LYSE/YGGA) [Bacillus cytotoxicus NVH 391-98]AWC28772.1 lysine transporter LysE [Bacillus cytotoxicus]AWC32779.1 lysine transporter LysE [Bacillus cytotoxicus]AWC36806.1 lysine transporter LysE [Bacillus cytotoxicus]AWC39845.1 lysine transporter LysE [Bacillus cytotoxicus]